MNFLTPADALKRAIEIAGGTSSFARCLPPSERGVPVSPCHVHNWLYRSKRAPAQVCPDIELITGVRCELLRPDVNWAVLRAPRKGRKRITATP